MKNKTLFNSLLFSFSLLGSFFVLNKPLKAENAPVCPDPEEITISSVYNLSNENDPNSFYGLTGGFCRGTPDKYGVKVFKMGFCKKNPANPTGSSILEGSKPDYSSCTWAYENSSGEIADFSAGGSIDLTDAYSSTPASGTYPHAVMIISKDFRIKGQYGPVGGNTYYTTSTFEKSSTNINDYAITTAPLKSFDGPEKCTATTENESVVGGTISAYLLDSTGTILVSDSTNTGVPCSGMEKLLGVMNMSSDLTISSATKGLKMTFVVTDNGMSVITNGEAGSPPTEIILDSGPFSVTFDTF